MTGFGRASAKSDEVEVICECSSVNRKHLDMQVRLPQDLSGIEPEVRTLISKSCSRGYVTLTCSVKRVMDNKASMNEARIEEIRLRFQSLADRLGNAYNQDSLFNYLLNDREVWQSIGEKGADVLLKAVSGALQALDSSKVLEGKALEKDFFNRLTTLKALCAKVQETSQAHFERYRLKIQKLLASLGGEGLVQDPKVAQELALLIEKSDITEEIVRATFHLDHLLGLISDPKCSGRQIEFILQELVREWNTMGSKVQDIEVTKHVIDAKCEIERLREQVQNVE